MNRKELNKYFDKRPRATELYVVAGLVFSDYLAAANYADQVDAVLETHHRDATEDTETPEEINFVGFIVEGSEEGDHEGLPNEGSHVGQPQLGNPNEGNPNEGNHEGLPQQPKKRKRTK